MLKGSVSIRFITLIFLIVMVSSLSAQTDEQITLVIWGEPGTVGCVEDTLSTWEFCNYVRAFNASWEAAYPNITLQWENHGWDTDLYNELQTAIAEGNAPDLTVGESIMPLLLQAGQLAPLNLSDELLANLIPAPIQAVSDGDDLYGVAAFTAVFTLEINADVFLFVGINPNTTDLSTWDAVAETAAHITETSNGEFYGFSILGPTAAPAAAMLRFAPYLYQNGADFCNMPDCDTPTFNDPAGVEVYEWFRELYQYTPPGLAFLGDEGAIFSQLFAGITAMQTAGSWHPSWAAGSGCENCRYLPLPLPDDGERANVVVGNAMYGILADSPNQEAAQLFLEWMVSDEMQNNLFWTGVGGRLPTTYSGIAALEEVMGGDTSSVPNFYTRGLGKTLSDAPAEAALYEVFISELMNGDVRILPPWKNSAIALNILWNEMFSEILTSSDPITDILDAYQAQAEALIAP